jgi:4-hydroxythreonine-4-phosphate dehydrogenase
VNPHAGEEGIFGVEEETIGVAIKEAHSVGIDAQGPYPADSLFIRKNLGSYDCFVAMYHDQGLIPVKLLDFDSAVNVTLGLPFIRTSPAHGTAFDIAGKGVANPSSMIEAIRLAAKMARRKTCL